jgi:hypothetical protein
MVTQALDAFYVTDHAGRKIVDPARSKVQTALLAALDADAPRATAAAGT